MSASESDATQSELNSSDDESEFVTILVGRYQTPFTVELNLLSNASDFFRVAFRSDFKEGKEKLMRLEDTDDNVFDFILDFLETGRLDPCLDDYSGGDGFMRSGNYLGVKEFAWDYYMSSIYVFSVIYMLDSVAAKSLQSFGERLKRYESGKLRDFPTAATVSRIFNEIPDDSPLRKKFIDAFVRPLNSQRRVIRPHDESLRGLPSGFTTPVLEALKFRRSALEDQLVHIVCTSRDLSRIIDPTKANDRSYTDFLAYKLDEEAKATAAMEAKMTELTVENNDLRTKNEDLGKEKEDLAQQNYGLRKKMEELEKRLG
ncbi:hypothetical protein HDK77DRAFT_502047 [Phyllosticta capitalensis]